MRLPRFSGTPTTLLATGAAGLSLALLLACQPPVVDESTPLETVEVDRGPTEVFSPDDDAVAAGSSSGVSGALPGNFPDDLPIFEPSSVTDFGVLDDSSSFLVLHTDRELSEVTGVLRSALDRSTWQPDGSTMDRKKGELFARYQIAPAESGGNR